MDVERSASDEQATKPTQQNLVEDVVTDQV